MADTPFYVNPRTGEGIGSTANDYQYYQDQGIINPNIDWSSTSAGAPGLINTTPSATSGDVTLQNILADTQASSVNDAPKPEAIAGAEKSATLGKEEKGFWDTVGESLSKTMKKSGGEIFANTLAGSANGVLMYLLQRRKERADLDLENRRNQNKVNETNAAISRASAMPRVGSVIKSPQPSQSPGLINARRA